MIPSTTRARELTDWFPPDVKPAHIGVYWTDLGPAYQQFGYSHWNGKQWGNQYETAERAKERGHEPGVQDKSWRGLKEQAC